jgi:hypothetical protein
MKLLLSILVVLLSASFSSAAHKHKEKYYQKQWCNANNGFMEVVLADGSRVDCITKTHAVEFDFINKWAEAVGQALHYSIMTEKTAGIVLIGKNDELLGYVKDIAEVYNIKIDIWNIPE